MRYIFAFCMVVLCACTPTSENSVISQTVIETVNATPSRFPMPTATLIAIPATPTIEPINLICSPLEGETLQDLVTNANNIITQPFKQPRPGIDDGHTGVDFAYYRKGDRVGIEGLNVLSVLDGKVSSIINDSWPYGHLVIIETPLDELSSEMVSKINFPELQPTVVPHPAMAMCPTIEVPLEVNFESRSLYVLYAHLQHPSNLLVGEAVSCGQVLGQVGNTGKSSNPHLHFETRIGPSGANFESMAYYTTQATEMQRYNYCVWRVSNLFQVFDPMVLLNYQP